MLVFEITIAVLLGVIVIVLGIYVTYFSINSYKLNKQRLENGDYELINFSKREKILSIIFSVYFALSLGLFTINLVYRSTPYVNHKYYVSVNSNSMATALNTNTYLEVHQLKNQIAQYSVVEFKKIEPENEIKKYDIILFKKEGKLIVHRIIDINSDGNYITQGDNNLHPDDWVVTRDEIKGLYNKTLQFMSFINYITYTPGFYVSVIGATYILGVSLYFEIKNNKLQKKVK